LETPYGIWAMYLWSAGDIALITVAVATTGGGNSQIWAVYTLTTLFFAASYPARGQFALLGLTAACYFFALGITGWDITAASVWLRFSILLLVFLMASFLARELRSEMEKHGEASLRARFAEAEARRSEWFRALVQEASDIVTSFDVDGRILYISPAVRSLGYDPDALLGTDVALLVHPEDLERVTEQLTLQVDEGLEPRTIEYRARAADGTFRYLEGMATNLLDDPGVQAIVVDARDVTDRKNAEMLLASQTTVLQQIASGEAIDVVLRRVAMMVEEQAHAQCTIVVHGTDDQRLLVVSSDPRHRDLLVVDPDGAGWSREIRSSLSNEVLGEVRLRFTTARFASDREQQVGAAAADLAAIVLERDSAASQLAHQASHDSLTGLPNRQVLLGAIEEILTHPEGDQTLALLFVDLDGFKDVNDSYGHHVGDQVLIALGHRLSGALRKHDMLARFGGDEFVALCRVDDLDHARHLAGRVLEKVRQPIAIGSRRVRLDSSIGISTAHVTGEIQALTTSAAWVQATADELVHEADRAMYRAKESGGGRIEVWNADGGPQLRAAADPE
jgi:diguanylate cyclase (GGDEF)-like protein/PAS domain S-box-containing protein